jgi:drug/metabolite transporter (DMT)-like permease
MKSLVRFVQSIDSSLHTAFATRPKSLGRIYAFCASIFGYLNPFVVQLSGETNTIRVMLFRGLVLCFASYFVMQTSDSPRTYVHKSIIYKLIMRGFLAVVMFFTFYWALNYMSLQIALTLSQTSPMMTYLLAILVGTEALTRERVSLLMGILVGLALIISPRLLFLEAEDTKKEEHGAMYLLAVGMVLFTAFLKAVVFMLLKTLKENDPMINNFYWSSTNILICGVLFLVTGTTFECTPFTAMCFVLNGLTTFGFQTFNFKAIKFEDTSVVAVICSLPVLYSFLVDVFIMGNPPEVGAVVGSFLVLIFMSWLTLIERKPTKSLPDGSGAVSENPKG